MFPICGVILLQHKFFPCNCPINNIYYIIVNLILKLKNTERRSNRVNLLDQVRDVMRRRHYSIRTEQAYVEWIKRFVLFYNKRHPKYMGEEDISQYLSYLATDQRIASSTQNQALNAIVFLYKHVFRLSWVILAAWIVPRGRRSYQR